METSFAPEPANVRVARRFVAESLSRSAGSDPVEVAVLLTSELVTNVVLHARTRVSVRVETRRSAVRVEVADESPLQPEQRAYESDASTGRGLSLVEALASRWGTDKTHGGKVVWFELDLEPA